jgi:hypothetical protein
MTMRDEVSYKKKSEVIGGLTGGSIPLEVILRLDREIQGGNPKGGIDFCL